MLALAARSDVALRYADKEGATMSAEFKVNQTMSKKELIDEYNRLLDAYKEKVAEVKEAARRRTETEKQSQTAALHVAREASVQSVVDSVGQLRGLMGKTLNDLTEKMSAAAERLDQLSKAIGLQEARLKELHDIEVAADTFRKLMDVYDQRRNEVEAMFSARTAEMEKAHAARKQAQEEESSARKELLAAEIDQTKAAWKQDQEAVKKALAEEKAQLKKEREREEAEYVYERDRARKIEEHQYLEKKTALEKQLKETKESTLKDLTERESAVAARETELDELNVRVEKFPATLQKEIEAAKKELKAVMDKEAQHQAALAAMERDWERKMHEQNVQRMEEILAGKEKQIAELQAQLTAALKNVQSIADKAVEGASHSRAFQSVNQIALEQARRPDGKGKE
jgi:chromosome segregation ATPase